MNEFWNGFWMAIVAWGSSFFIPIVPFLLFTIVLVGFDLFTGTKAAKSRGEPINSRGLRRTVEKIALYFVAILLGQGITQVFMPSIPVAYVVAFAIALTEFKSNIENVEQVTGARIWHLLKDRFKLK